MGMNTAVMTGPPTFSTGSAYPGYSGVAGLPQPTDYGLSIPGMTQLPALPQPYFPSPGGGLGSGFPPLPTPEQLLSGLTAGPPAANPYRLAQSVPLTPPSLNLPDPGPLADIPDPHTVAPWLFMPQVHLPQPAFPQGGYGQPAKGWQAEPQPQQPPVMNKAQTPPPPAPAPTPPPPPAQAKAPEMPDSAGLDDATVRGLNERLNDPDENKRADAGMDLYKILEKNPALADSPTYQPYIHAFVEKLMKDPSELPRGAGELILQMGFAGNGNANIEKALSQLSKKGSITGEDSIVSGLLGGLKGKTLINNRPKPEIDDTASKGLSSTPTAPGQPPGGGAAMPPVSGQPGQAPGGSPPPPSGGLPVSTEPNAVASSAPLNPAANLSGPDTTALPMQSPPAPALASPYGAGMPFAPMGGMTAPSAGMMPVPPQPFAFPGGGMPWAGPAVPQAGGRLNLMSAAPAAMPMPPRFTGAGQRLNVWESANPGDVSR